MKYDVLATYTYQRFLGTFEAESEEQAIEMAENTLSCNNSCSDNFIDYPILAEVDWVAEKAE